MYIFYKNIHCFAKYRAVNILNIKTKNFIQRTQNCIIIKKDSVTIYNDSES